MAFPKAKKKSGDSKLQDATAAREEERLKHASMEKGPEYHQHLLKEVEDSAEKKRAVGDVAGAERAEAANAKLVAVIEAMEKRIIHLESKRADDQLTVKRPDPLMKCPTCYQVLKLANGRGVCDGTHIPVLVAPSNMDMWAAFQGVSVNGARYAGRCILPVAIVDTVKSEISRWERAERQKFIPGGKVVGEHDFRYTTGSLSPGQSPLI